MAQSLPCARTALAAVLALPTIASAQHVDAAAAPVAPAGLNEIIAAARKQSASIKPAPHAANAGASLAVFYADCRDMQQAQNMACPRGSISYRHPDRDGHDNGKDNLWARWMAGSL